MATYKARERVALSSGIIEKGQVFASDAVPGNFWEPVDKDAKDAVKQRDLEREAQAAKDAKPSRGDPRVHQFQARIVELEAENADLRSQIDDLTAPPKGDEAKADAKA